MNKSVLKTLVIGCFLLSGCTSQQVSEIDDFGLTIGKEKEEQAAMEVQMKKVSCEDSGGSFIDAKCECPSDTEKDGSATYVYDEESGNCTDQFGLPGGVLGQEEKENSPIAE